MQRKINHVKKILLIAFSKSMVCAVFDEENWAYYINHHPFLFRRVAWDLHGVPHFNYGGSIGIQYTPVITALCALDLWNRGGGLSVKKEVLNRFLFLADWLTANAETYQNRYGWFYHFDYVYKGITLSAPWLSAMGNSMAISVLVRAWTLTRKQVYLETCERALEVFSRSISAGGVQTIDAHGCVWFEEYPILSQPHVLNGFIFTLLGLYDFSLVGHSEAKLLFLEGIKTLEQHLHDYDLGYWTTYDLLFTNPSGEVVGDVLSKEVLGAQRSIAFGHYHAIHVQQVYILYLLTKKEIFRQFYTRWLSYYQPGSLIRWVLKK